MLKNILVVCTLIAAAYGIDQLTVLNQPKALLFKDGIKLESRDVVNVLTAALGLSIQQATDYKGFAIQDAFTTPRAVVFITFNAPEPFNSEQLKTISIPINGNEVQKSLNDTDARIQKENLVSVNLDISNGAVAFEPYKILLGDIKAKPEKISTTLKPEDNKAFFEQLFALKALNGWFSTTKSSLPTFVNIQLNVTDLVKSTVQGEGMKILTSEIEALTNTVKKAYSENDVLVLCYTTSNDVVITRTRRAAEPNKGDPIPTDINLAKVYSEDYPVIFNIILWFGVVIAFSLLAISYAIASMDPGRDSIIYRMTSNRIKKDN